MVPVSPDTKEPRAVTPGAHDLYIILFKLQDSGNFRLILCGNLYEIHALRHLSTVVIAAVPAYIDASFGIGQRQISYFLTTDIVYAEHAIDLFVSFQIQIDCRAERIGIAFKAYHHRNLQRVVGGYGCNVAIFVDDDSAHIAGAIP